MRMQQLLLLMSALAGALSFGCTKAAEQKRTEQGQRNEKALTETPKAGDFENDAVNAPVVRPADIAIVPPVQSFESIRDEFAKSIETRLKSGRESIERLEQLATEKAAITAVSPVVASTRARLSEAVTQLEIIKNATPEQWASLKANMDAKVGELDTAVSELEQQIAAH